jgi:hypothetical protein
VASISPFFWRNAGRLRDPRVWQARSRGPEPLLLLRSILQGYRAPSNNHLRHSMACSELLQPSVFQVLLMLRRLHRRKSEKRSDAAGNPIFEQRACEPPRNQDNRTRRCGAGHSAREFTISVCAAGSRRSFGHPKMRLRQSRRHHRFWIYGPASIPRASGHAAFPGASSSRSRAPDDGNAPMPRTSSLARPRTVAQAMAPVDEEGRIAQIKGMVRFWDRGG